MSMKIRRSSLFAPADKIDLMEKIVDTNADVAVFDLEDAVPETNKEQARNNLLRIQNDVDFGRKEIAVRINGIRTNNWLDDLIAAIDANIDIIKLPMVESPDDIKTVVNTASQLTNNIPEITIAVESPSGLYSGPDIARYCKQISEVTGMSFGVGDYCRIIGAPDINSNIEEFMSKSIIGCAAVGDLAPYYTVYTDINDLDGLREQAQKGYNLGYIGQTAIHPDQVSVINEVYTPDKDTVESARKLVEKYDSMATDSVVIDNIFLDTAIVDRYRNLINRYDEILEMDNNI